MLSLVMAALAVFFIWEFVLVAVPWTIPIVLQPVLVYAAALAYCWPDWRTALAVAGAVGVLHVLVTRPGATTGGTQGIRRPPRQPSIPRLP